MCGIFAIINSPNAARELYFGMVHLQHRGQDACGMLTVSQKDAVPKFNVMKFIGHVHNNFSEEKLDRLDGSMGIGHTRYPTCGINDASETQPLTLPSPEAVGLAFNGNVVNYPSLKRELQERHGRIMSTESDGEVLLNLFAVHYNEKDNVQGVKAAVRKVMEKAVGGYSVVMQVGGKGILAFKDPNGIKPMVMGRRVSEEGTSYAFASESVSLSAIGFTDIADVKGGEMVFIGTDLRVYREFILPAKAAPCSFEWVYFSTAESIIEGKSVYDVRERLGIHLAKKVKALIPDERIDVVIPVPDTSRTAALALANTLGVPYQEGLIKNRYIGRTFIMPSQSERQDAIRLKLRPIDHVIRNKNVLVVDDSIVRGTTSKKIIQLLRSSGAARIYFISTFPPIRHPCFYGIDFQTEKELVAHGRTRMEVEKELGADRLIYIEPEDLKAAIGLDSVCMACVDGNYPTPTQDMAEMKNTREIQQKIIAGRKGEPK